MSLGARFLAAGGCFVAPFALCPEVFGVLLGIGEAGTFKGAGPIVDNRGRNNGTDKRDELGWWLQCGR